MKLLDSNVRAIRASDYAVDLKAIASCFPMWSLPQRLVLRFASATIARKNIFHFFFLVCQCTKFKLKHVQMQSLWPQ